MRKVDRVQAPAPEKSSSARLGGRRNFYIRSVSGQILAAPNSLEISMYLLNPIPGGGGRKAPAPAGFSRAISTGLENRVHTW